MADEDDDQYPGHASGIMDPTLQTFVQQFQSPASRQWAAEAAQRVQQHLTITALAKQNQAAGEQFVQNMNSTKNSLVSMVRGDPTAAGMALDLVPHMMQAMAAEHPGLDDDTRDAAASQITAHVQNQIAHATVQSLAEKDEGAARQALASPRLSALLSDDDKSALDQYIGHQAGFRQQDANAQALQAQQDAARAGYERATQYLGALAHPDTGALQFPPKFGATLMGDQAVSMNVKGALHSAYGELQAGGDPPASNPMVVSSMMSRIAAGNPPIQAEILGHLGTNLNLGDAQFLNAQIGPQTPRQAQDTKQIADTMAAVQNQIASPSNGAAGQNAYGRFVNWFTPALRTGQATGLPVASMLDPEHQDTILDKLPQFQPTAQDAVAGKTWTIPSNAGRTWAIPQNPATTIGGAPAAPARQPLSQIFGQGAPVISMPQTPTEVPMPQNTTAIPLQDINPNGEPNV